MAMGMWLYSLRGFVPFLSLADFVSREYKKIQ